MSEDTQTPPIERALALPNPDEVSHAGRLIYATLLARGEMTVSELADALLMTESYARNELSTLAEMDRVEDAGPQPRTGKRGRLPHGYRALYPCPECGSRHSPAGMPSHMGSQHGLNAKAVREMDPEDVGLDPTPPAPDTEVGRITENTRERDI
jgi:DNA-binding transcriptional ArsR family regulator